MERWPEPLEQDGLEGHVMGQEFRATLPIGNLQHRHLVAKLVTAAGNRKFQYGGSTTGVANRSHERFGGVGIDHFEREAPLLTEHLEGLGHRRQPILRPDGYRLIRHDYWESEHGIILSSARDSVT